MLGGYTVIHLASHTAGMDGGGFLHHGRYRGIAAVLERGGIMLRRHFLLGLLLPLPILCCVRIFRILPAQKLRLLLWG